mmetsp:Transcript_17384/g.19462  ORF Transcript_17384/g.19462 Transcript_17384/m.19462 type:complete len:221 (+) Transcript_17384:106-768(+)
MNKQQGSCETGLISSMTEERLQCHGTKYGRDFESTTSDGDDYQLERDNEYKKFISEKESSPTRSIQFLLPKLLPKHKSAKHKSPLLQRLHPNTTVNVSCRKKQDTKHRVNGFMHRLSLQMRRRCPTNEDSAALGLLQVQKPSPETQTVERSPCGLVHLVRGPTLHPYRTSVPTLHPYHTVPASVFHDHEAVGLHFSFSLIDDDDYFLDTIDDNDPSDIHS